MAFCKHCGTEMLESDQDGNPGLFCPNNCVDEIISAEFKGCQNRLTHKEFLEFLECLDNEPPFSPGSISQNIEKPREKHYTNNCWVTIGNTKCPGKIDSMNNKKDGDYGYFCPVCGHSLRNHPEYGEKARKDRAAKIKI